MTLFLLWEGNILQGIFNEEEIARAVQVQFYSPGSTTISRQQLWDRSNIYKYMHRELEL